jgi:hypothetical protein
MNLSTNDMVQVLSWNSYSCSSGQKYPALMQYESWLVCRCQFLNTALTHFNSIHNLIPHFMLLLFLVVAVGRVVFGCVNSVDAEGGSDGAYGIRRHLR